jgi:DNA-binding transcriptional LysR family regulator
MLDVHRLRVFRSVVAAGSINAAAASLGYTPSAVSQQLAALQRETGLTLVARAGRGIQPTAAGLALAEEIDGVLHRLGGVESLVADLREGRHGALSIAYFASVGSAWMPTVVRNLLRDFPRIRLALTLRDDVPAAASERPDVQVVVEREGLSPGPAARAYRLLVDPYVAVLPRSHPLASASVVELAALAADPWVDNDSAGGWCRRTLVEACHAAGFAPPFRVEAHDYPAAIAFVDAGIGVTVLPSLAARTLPDGVVSVPVTGPTPQRTIYAVVQTAVEETPAVRSVLQTLRTCAGL